MFRAHAISLRPRFHCCLFTKPSVPAVGQDTLAEWGHHGFIVEYFHGYYLVGPATTLRHLFYMTADFPFVPLLAFVVPAGACQTVDPKVMARTIIAEYTCLARVDAADFFLSALCVVIFP